jgi:RND family efflux transporter MFP subunit
MKKPMSALAILLLCSLGCSKKNEFQPPPPPEVSVAHPEIRDVTVYESFPGRLQAVDSVQIRARVKGFLKSIHFKDGQRVEKGDLLFTVEPDEYEAAVQAAKARLNGAQAERKLAEATLQRTRKAYETQAVSEVDLLKAEAEEEAAQANVLAAEAALENASRDLSYTEISAPMAGRLSTAAMSPGNLVGGGEPTLLAVLVSERPLHVYFNVDERFLLPYLRNGAMTPETEQALPPISLELADGTRHDEQGTLDYIDPEIDPETGTLRVRAVFPNRKLQLLPGLFGRALIPEEIEKATLVPDLAVQRDLSGAYVLVVNGENKVESRYVQTGALVDGNRIITEGLTGDDRVVVKGIQRARPGITVRASNAQQAEPAAE